MCWLRSRASPAKATEGSSAGDRACVPDAGSGKWFRILVLGLLVAAVLKYRDRLWLFVSAAASLKRGSSKFGVPALEMTKDCGLDDDDPDENFSLIGRSRKRSSG